MKYIDYLKLYVYSNPQYPYIIYKIFKDIYYISENTATGLHGNKNQIAYVNQKNKLIFLSTKKNKLDS